jgi:hypothetical protein
MGVYHWECMLLSPRKPRSSVAQHFIISFFDICFVGVMYSGENDACDVTLSVYPHRAGLKNMPGHGGNRTYYLWNTSPMNSNYLITRKKFKN